MFSKKKDKSTEKRPQNPEDEISKAEMQEQRMKELWGKLRAHVKSKSKIIDFIKVSQIKAEEKRLEGINDEDDVDEEEERGTRNKKKSCQEMLIIHP